MADILTPDQLAEIEARADKATPNLISKACGGHSVVLAPVLPRHNNRNIPAYGWRPENGWSIACPFMGGDDGVRVDFVCFSHDDARLFANARPYILTLLAHVRALEARLAERGRLLSEAQTFLEREPESAEPGSPMFTWRHQVDEELKEPQP